MKKSCLLTGSNDSLFRQLVASLLSDSTGDLDLYDYETANAKDLLNEVQRLQPNLLILEEATPFIDNSMLMNILILGPSLPVIVISGESNEMHIIQRETISMNSSHDLLKTVNHISQYTARQGAK